MLAGHQCLLAHSCGLFFEALTKHVSTHDFLRWASFSSERALSGNKTVLIPQCIAQVLSDVFWAVCVSSLSGVANLFAWKSLCVLALFLALSWLLFFHVLAVPSSEKKKDAIVPSGCKQKRLFLLLYNVFRTFVLECRLFGL